MDSNIKIPKKPDSWFFDFRTGLLLWCTLFTLNLHVSWHDPIRFSNAKECLGINCRFFCFLATAATLFADAYALRAIFSENAKYPHKDMIIGVLLVVFLYLVYYSYKNTPHYTRFEPDEMSCLSEEEKKQKEFIKKKYLDDQSEKTLFDDLVDKLNEWAGNITKTTRLNDDINVMDEEKIWPRQKRLNMWFLVFIIDVMLVYRDLRLGHFDYLAMMNKRPNIFKFLFETIIRFIGMLGPVIDFINIKLNYDFKACKYGLDDVWNK